jgi:hypothetical protein
LTDGIHLSAATPSPTLSSLSLSRCPVGPSYRCQFLCPRAPLLSLLCGPVLLVVEPLPRALALSLAVPWASPVSSALPALAVDQRARTRRNPRPQRLPTRPSSLFEPRPRLHSLPHLISCSPAPARALPTSSDLAGDLRPPPRSSSSPEATPSDPELRPEVRHPPPCLFYSIRACL